MPKVLTNNNLNTADIAGGTELAADVASLYGPASMYASPAAAVAGIVKNIALYKNNE
jgi:hypothetical protein